MKTPRNGTALDLDRLRKLLALLGSDHDGGSAERGPPHRRAGQERRNGLAGADPRSARPGREQPIRRISKSWISSWPASALPIS